MALTVLYPNAITKKIYCTWTHTTGAAADTIAVTGKVIEVRAYEKKSSGSSDVEVAWSVSTSDSVDTISIYSQATITDGMVAIEFIPR